MPDFVKDLDFFTEREYLDWYESIEDAFLGGDDRPVLLHLRAWSAFRCKPGLNITFRKGKEALSSRKSRASS